MFVEGALAGLWTWLAGVMTVLITLYLIGTWNYDTFRKRKMWHIPPKFPFVGNIAPLFTAHMTYPTLVLDLYNKAKGRPYVGVFEFRTPIIMLRDPQLMKDIMVKYFDNFTGHRNLASPEMDPLLARNIFNMHGDEWRRMKQFMSPVFTSSRLKTQFILLRECAQYSRTYVEKRIRDHDQGNPTCNALDFDLKELYTKLTLNVIASIAFGVGVNSYEDPGNELMKAASEFATIGTEEKTTVVAGYMLFPKLMKLLGLPLVERESHEIIHRTVQRSMDDRLINNIPRPDVIQLLLPVQEQDPSFTKMDLTAVAMAFFLASYETVSTQLFLASYMLATHAKIQCRVQQEIDTVLGGRDSKEVTYEDVKEMTYLEQVILEVFRLHPSLLTIDRVCERACTIPLSSTEPPLHIKTGEIVMFPIYALHHDPEHFPDPSKFDPDRFSEENIKNMKPNTYIPFGYGPRKCLGQRFSIVEIKLVLATLLSQFSFCVTDKSSVPFIMKKKNFLWIPELGYNIGLSLRN